MNDLKKKKDAKRQQTFFLFLWKKKKIKETIIRCSKWDKRQKFVWKVIIPSTKCSIGVFYRWLIKLLELLFRARSTRVKRRMTRANRTIGVNFSCQLPLGFAPFSPLPTPHPSSRRERRIFARDMNEWWRRNKKWIFHYFSFAPAPCLSANSSAASLPCWKQEECSDVPWIDFYE